MNIVFYVFVALVLSMLNEFRLIKKYAKAHENNFKKTTIQNVIQFLASPFIALKNWINYTLLNNDLNY